MRLLLTILWTIGVISLQAQPDKPDRDHVSVRFRAKRPESDALPAKLGSVLLHFERDDEEDS